MATFGTDLLQELMGGSGPSTRSSATAVKTRDLVVPALAELVEHGARVRPMVLHGKQVGFLRGVHYSERSHIYNWYVDPIDRVTQMLLHGTTLTPDEVEGLSSTELQNILALINRMTQADVSLYPYISAFSTTSTSEMLWYGRGAQVATWTRSRIEIPGGWAMDLLAPPEHARLWSGVAVLRERSKKRLDDTYNAALITRALVGKGADKLYHSLKQTQKALQSDTLEPWINLVPPEERAIENDGWGHAHQDDSREGLLHELESMQADDKHEQLMAKFYEQQMAAAQKEADTIDSLTDELEDIEDVATILTSLQVRDMDRAIQTQAAQRDEFVRDAIDSANDQLETRERRAAGHHEPRHL